MLWATIDTVSPSFHRRWFMAAFIPNDDNTPGNVSDNEQNQVTEPPSSSPLDRTIDRIGMGRYTDFRALLSTHLCRWLPIYIAGFMWSRSINHLSYGCPSDHDFTRLGCRQRAREGSFHVLLPYELFLDVAPSRGYQPSKNSGSLRRFEHGNRYLVGRYLCRHDVW